MQHCLPTKVGAYKELRGVIINTYNIKNTLILGWVLLQLLINLLQQCTETTLQMRGADDKDTSTGPPAWRLTLLATASPFTELRLSRLGSHNGDNITISSCHTSPSYMMRSSESHPDGEFISDNVCVFLPSSSEVQEFFLFYWWSVTSDVTDTSNTRGFNVFKEWM